MGFPTGDIKLSSNFELNISKPLDSRNVVTNYSDLANISFKYAGMIVFVTATNKHYGLKNNLTSWSEFNMGTSGSGGGGGSSSAGNGLSISSGVIQLGGTLTNTLTSINLNNKALRFVNGANTLFNVDEGLLYDNNNKESVDTVNRFLKDNNETISTLWQARKLVDAAGGAALDWANKNTGLGISSNSMWAYFKSDLINTTNKTFQLPNKNGTVMLTSDLYQSGTNFFLPISGGTMLGNVTMGYNTLLKGTSKLTPSFGGFEYDNKISLSENNSGANGIIINTELKSNPFNVYTRITTGGNFNLQTRNLNGYNTYIIAPTQIGMGMNFTGGGQTYYNADSGGHFFFTSNNDSNPVTQKFARYYFYPDRFSISNQGYNVSGEKFVHLKTLLTTVDRTIYFPDGDGTLALLSDINSGNYLSLDGGTMGGAIDLNYNQLNRVKEISNSNTSGALIDMNYSGGNILLLSGNKETLYPYVAVFKQPKQINLENSLTNGLIINDVQGAYFKNDLRLLSADNQNFATFKQPNNLTNDRDYLLPDASGTLALVENITNASLINDTYYVSVQYGNDTMGQKGNILKPFKTIKEAVNQSTSGDTIHVFAGIYDEYQIPTKSYLTIHLEDGVRIIPTFNNGQVAVFSDLILSQPAYNFRITGKGEILGNGQAGNDTTSLVASYSTSKYYIEAKKVRSMEAWGQIGAAIYVKNTLIDFEAMAYAGGELYFDNCSFINFGGVVYGYGNQGYSYTYKNCYFERNGTNFDYLNTWGADNTPVLYIAPAFTSPQKGTIIFDNCDFVQKVMNKDIMYIQSVNYDAEASIQFNNCKFYNVDNTKKSIVFTTDAFVALPVGANQSNGYENGNLKMFFLNNVSNVDVDNVNTAFPMTNQLPSSGFFINPYFKLNRKFIS